MMQNHRMQYIYFDKYYHSYWISGISKQKRTAFWFVSLLVSETNLSSGRLAVLSVDHLLIQTRTYEIRINFRIYVYSENIGKLNEQWQQQKENRVTYNIISIWLTFLTCVHNIFFLFFSPTVATWRSFSLLFEFQRVFFCYIFFSNSYLMFILKIQFLW